MIDNASQDRISRTGSLAAPELLCYRVQPDAPKIVPARSERAWMDRTNERFAYRCIPLSIANASGWEILIPRSIEATWFGGDALSDMHVRWTDGGNGHERLAVSHFGHGVLTFHTGWLFRTPPGWAVWARGSPNSHWGKIVPLEGLVETDWLALPFTMNWRFTRPGTVRFPEGEPFCFITLAPHGVLDSVQPRLADLADAPGLKAAHDDWAAGRADFNARLKHREPSAVAQGWQRTYVRGKGAGEDKPAYHLSKRRLQPPR